MTDGDTNQMVDDSDSPRERSADQLYRFGAMQHVAQYFKPVEIAVSCPECEVEMDKTYVAEGTYNWSCPKCENRATTLAAAIPNEKNQGERL